MFEFFRKKRLVRKISKKALDYVQQNYIAPPVKTICYSIQSSDIKVQYSDREETIDIDKTKKESSSDVRYSRDFSFDERYNEKEISRTLKNYFFSLDCNETLKILDKNINPTFVDRLLYYINKKGVRDSEVYKAAQIDKRLFSKIISNNEYKPSKDTVIALAMALKLSLAEANDLLSRVGYAFSHSNKRDIIIEFFFREKMYNLIDANDVLSRLDQKLIGRF